MMNIIITFVVGLVSFSSFALECVDTTSQLSSEAIENVSININKAFQVYSNGMSPAECQFSNYICSLFVCTVDVRAIAIKKYIDEDELTMPYDHTEYSCEFTTIVKSLTSNNELSYKFIRGGCSSTNYYWDNQK